MDLTEIMDFLNEMNDASELNVTGEGNMSLNLESVGDLSPLQRVRANTWHGNRSIVKSEPLSSLEKENRTTPTDSIPGDSCTQSSNKHLGVDQSSSMICRKSISRRNAWGNFSYADMITKAINSSPEKRMTLSEIYNWMVQNIPFFKDKGDTNSSAGWKNSIRHNLSLHSCFMRVQNEGTGKSSWWMINPDYKASKLPRRRAVTMDNSKALSLNQRKPKAAKKADSLGSNDGLGGANTKSRSSSSDLNFIEPKPEVSSTEDVFLPQDFRPRSSSNSIKTLRLSPALEADDPPEQISSWPVSEAPDMEMQDYSENHKYYGKMFPGSGTRVQSPQMNIKSPGPHPTGKNSDPRSIQLPSSLPAPSSMSQEWNYDDRDQVSFMNQDSYKGMRTSEHILLSGGGLVNAAHKKIMRNIPPQSWMSKSPNSTPLLRDYLSRDDYDAKQGGSSQGMRSDILYHQKLYSGGGHKVAPNSPNFSSASINVSPSWQQQQPHLSHGLLLQLLTDSNQQQIPERKSSPQQHTQTYSHSPTNQSMLQHLLTVRQKSHRQVLPGGQQQYHQYLLSSHQPSPHQIHSPMDPRIPPSQLPQHFFDGMGSIQYQHHISQQQSTTLPQLLPQPIQFNNQVPPQHQFRNALLQGESAKSNELLNVLEAESHFPSDLDFSLLELDSSADIECNIDQVIDHEKKFGELWDFTFDEDFLPENKNFHESIK